MCGFGGIVSLDGSPVDRSRLDAMSRQLHHRGPDEGATWVAEDAATGLVHRRLSIIDLAGSHQPMHSEPAADGGRLTIAFNGEVLNYPALREAIAYPYRTRGDTETILAAHVAHGSDAPRLLAGQFAYAMHDRVARTTTLARDRLGILPLFWCRTGRNVVFASEVPALLAGLGTVPELDHDALGDYLESRYVAAPRTLLRGVRKVVPGTSLVIGPDGVGSATPYFVARADPGVELDDATAVEHLDGLLGGALERALVADVPVGAYLSGGVDSSLIVAKARAAGADRLHTYCADFGDARFDETSHADVVSRHVGTVHETVPVRPADFATSWADLSHRRGAPLAEPADVALHRLAVRARQDVKVVLSGEGSDELFAGYPKHRFARATAAAGAVPHRLRAPVLRAAARKLPAGSRRLGVAVRALAEDSYDDRLAAWFAAFSSDEVEELTGAPRHRPAAGDGDGATSAPTALRRMMTADLRGWLPDNLLERGDRMSMAASLELRPPFLDRDVVDFSLTLPDAQLVRGRTTKWLVKEVARRHLPASIIDRPKVGFRVPLDTWFRGDLRDLTHDTVTAADSVTSSHLDRAAVATLLVDHGAGVRDNAVKLWTLASLEVWHAQLGRALE